MRQFNITIIVYCLLPNHYHFLLRQDGEDGANLVIQRAFNSYTKAYNKKYQHSGTLFEGNFQVKPVTHDAYMLHLCQYIHGNPIKHGLVKSLEDWPYSNYHEWVQTRNGTLVDHQFINDFFPNRQAYAQDVLAYAYGQSPWPDKVKRYFYDDE